VSDGLVQDLGHILERSGVSATIETHNLPRHPELARLADNFGVDIQPWVLGGGDDYELIIVVPPARMTKLWDLARRYELDVFDIGEIRSPEEELRVLAADGTPLDVSSMGGFRHFERQ
jgi:thiamine-monophosphate kinase